MKNELNRKKLQQDFARWNRLDELDVRLGKLLEKLEPGTARYDAVYRMHKRVVAELEGFIKHYGSIARLFHQLSNNVLPRVTDPVVEKLSHQIEVFYGLRRKWQHDLNRERKGSHDYNWIKKELNSINKILNSLSKRLKAHRDRIQAQRKRLESKRKAKRPKPKRKPRRAK